jgi:hypothetical protein
MAVGAILAIAAFVGLTCLGAQSVTVTRFAQNPLITVDSARRKTTSAWTSVAPSEVGDVEVPVRQIRDPALFEEQGRTVLIYSTCGEQGLAGADITMP